MNETDYALVNIILFVFLPIWCIAGYIDWYCHKKSKIEITTGLPESLLHSLMGVQCGVPIFLCLLFKVNALILLVCFASLIFHELVAFYDVRMATNKRHISILEMHVHAYLSTTPLFLVLMIVAINWGLVTRLIQSGVQGADQFTFIQSEYTFGNAYYLPVFSISLFVLCVMPYIEELFRCVRSAVVRRGDAS